MLVVVSYDVSVTTEGGAKRLRRVAKECQNYGQRVQNSIFECVVDPVEFEELKHRLLSIADKENDSIRFYFLGNQWRNKIENYGYRKNIDIDEPIVL